MIEATVANAIEHGQGLSVAVASWAEALLCNGLGKYEQAAIAAQRASSYDGEATKEWALVELIEAAARSKLTDSAPGALSWLAVQADVAGTDSAIGIDARSRALLSEGDAAEELYREALDHLGRTPIRPDLARAHLLYGEWLRREPGRGDAREQLRAAHEMLAGWGRRRSPSAPGASCRPPGRRCASEGRPSTELTARRRRSRGWRATGCRTRRSAPSCSSARARSSGTCARCSPSSASARAASLAWSSRLTRSLADHRIAAPRVPGRIPVSRVG